MAEEAGMGVRSSEEEKGREGEPLDDMEEGEIAEDEAALDPSAGTRGDAGGVPPHLLEHQWTFWFGNSSAARSKQAEWGSNIRPVHTFSTVEDFWGLYNNIRNPSKLAAGTDFHCFKYKIDPMWEDPVCANGGAWTISSNYRGKSDILWLYTLLAMIGEQFDHGDEICGAVVNVRGKQERIAIWTKDASNEASQLSIGRQWKQLLDYTEPIVFTAHDDSKKNGRHAKNRFTV